MTRKEIKKERNATIALMVSSIVACIINVVAVIMNLVKVLTAFNPISLLFVILGVFCAAMMASFIPDNLETIKECDRWLERHPE